MKILAICVSLLLGIVVSGCDAFESTSTLGENAPLDKEDGEAFKDSIDIIVESFTYIKDPRTELCFVYYWGGTWHGGPALANVPCQGIPNGLLVVAEVD